MCFTVLEERNPRVDLCMGMWAVLSHRYPRGAALPAQPSEQDTCVFQASLCPGSLSGKYSYCGHHGEAGGHGRTLYYVKFQMQVLVIVLCSIQSAFTIQIESTLFSPSPPALSSPPSPGWTLHSLSLMVTHVLLVFTSYFYSQFVLNYLELVFFINSEAFLSHIFFVFISFPIITHSFNSKNERQFYHTHHSVFLYLLWYDLGNILEGFLTVTS